MGCDPDAFLFFGFNVHSDDDYDKEKPACLEDEDDFYAGKMGVKPGPEAFFGDKKDRPSEGTPEYAEMRRQWDAYYEEKNKVVEGAGGKINFWGSDENQTHYAYIQQFNTDWEQSVEIKELPVISTEQIEKFKQYCEIMEIPWQEPKWHLAARYF